MNQTIPLLLMLAPAVASASDLPSALLADASMLLNLRTYADNIGIDGADRRDVVVQSMQAHYTSGWTPGPVELGVDASLFAALRLYAGDGESNRRHLAPSGRGQHRRVWAYPGGYSLKARIGATYLRYGLMQQENPVLEGKDTRSLPPAFRGLHVTHDAGDGLAFEAGSFDALKGRGSTELTPLTTAYGGVNVDTLRFVGVNWRYAPEGRLSVYADDARHVWRRWHGAITHGIGDPRRLQLIGSAAIYASRDHGRSLQGPIDNKAYSYQLALQNGGSQLALSLQRVVGNQFGDYVQETIGMYLANGMLADYIAPHERSVQVKFILSGADIGLPAWRLAAWDVSGDCDPVSAPGPGVPASLAELYNQHGQPLSGKHGETGVKISYSPPTFHGAVLTLIAVKHKGSNYFLEPGMRYLQLALNVPWKVF